MLFVAMGISFWWIFLTRLALAMVAVWTMRGVKELGVRN
jgi:hypothetical protein